MTQEEKNKIILDNWDKEGLANGWVNEHIKNNELKQQVEYLQSKINKVNKIIDENKDLSEWLHIPAWELQDILKEDK